MSWTCPGRNPRQLRADSSVLADQLGEPKVGYLADGDSAALGRSLQQDGARAGGTAERQAEGVAEGISPQISPDRLQQDVLRLEVAVDD